MRTFARRAVVVVAAVAILGSVTGVGADDPLASPESVGFSTDGLKAYQQAMRAYAS